MNRQFFLHTLVSRNVCSGLFRLFRFTAALLVTVGLLAAPSAGFAQSPPPPPPPPPPEPSDTSTVGQVVTNPITGMTTTVIDLRQDPAGTPTAGDTAFVQTADGYYFLVKDIGEFIYNDDAPPLAFEIVGPGATADTVLLDADPPGGPTAELGTGLTNMQFQDEFVSEDEEGALTPPEIESGINGVIRVRTGRNGSNGRDGALVVPPRAGGNGATGPSVTVNNSTNVNTATRFGILAASRGGRGGQGGDSYLSFWSGRDGGNGGRGGTVNVTNNNGVQVATSGTGLHGIFAYSRSGRAGDGGSGFAAPGGGTGGKSSNGGSVTVRNFGDVITTGVGAFGIYGLSVSNNGGNGGSQWGLVGESGDGGFGGSGGGVSITNESSGTINTFGDFSHGIFAQSVGGSGGSAGTGGNLLVTLLGSADNGGNGGAVDVINNGQIVTAGRFSRGMFAQSIGGGGGSGGGGGGLISIGGAGSGGGSAGRVQAFNNASGVISTFGQGSDGIFVQSVGGSAGAASGNGGLVAIGGSGGRAGNGGEVVARNFGSIITRGAGARGIVAQSIGGGGGDGGNTGGLIAVGGRGGAGGSGGIVRVTQGGSITTEGDDAAAVFTQSVGGGGGNGGSGNAGGPFVSVAVGGSGGNGGRGGDVEVTLQGRSDGAASVIRTEGDRSNGLFAQSVGGGGGNGGGSVSVSAGAFGALSVAVGGQGGQGGDGGLVTMSPGTGGVSVIETVGEDSTAVMLQSVGGGGGNGGYAVSVAGSIGLGGSASVSVGVGGDGGGGGEGGEVEVGTFDADDNLTETGLNGSILTTGDRSTGLLAQSVGGGGGNGGQAVSIAVAGSDGVGVAVAAGVGGSGAGGGAGGDVSVGTQGNVTTEGDASTGMLVQSVGGGGGNGGGSITGSLSVGGAAAGSVSLGIGGSAGTGNSGGNVVLATRDGTVTTSGESSTGIVAQSVGGGGGNGGYAVAVGAAGAGTGAGAVTIGLGGSGGSGGSGGEVRADLESDVDTSGDNSTGILAQSVGGGGGNGGFSVSAGIAGAGTGAGTVGVGLGGSGGSGASGMLVNASSAGTITTRGDNSSGFVAQSVGGGGGNGGFNVTGTLAAGGTGAGAVSVGLGGTGGTGATGGEVMASTSGDVVTEGDRSSGIVAQSVGGGGGNGGFNVSVALSGAGTGSGAVGVGLGGSGSAGGTASTVDLTVDNNVTTMGDDSTAVVAQSIGGGGGNGGFNVSVTGTGAGTGSVGVGVGIGGSGAGGSNAALVTSNVTGNLATLGDNSNGLLAQSVGGGGGNGGFNVSATISAAGSASGAIGVGIGGSGDGGGNGGNVISDLTGNVSTAGNDATGVIAQSLGGGGGNGAFNVTGSISGSGSGSGAVSVGVGGAAGDGGGAGTVDNTVTGNVATLGDNASGVFAQSLGGGGGNGGFNVSGTINIASSGGGAVAVGVGGSGGDGGGSSEVNNTVTGNVSTAGEDALGVVSQSIGGGGGNGGFNISGSVSATGSGGGNVAVGVGGSGGDGSAMAGAANADVTGNITTAQRGSGGLLVQSVGGGGGNGGMNITGALTLAGSGAGTVGVGVGGFGGDGGASGAVDGTLTGNITTAGDDSYGALLQSLGGGGGNGGLNVTAGVTMSSSGSGTLGVGVGGFGGLGGEASTVTGNITGDVSTNGRDAFGVMAQSLGGGGGNGGINVTGTVNLSKSASGSVAAGVGGFGGGAGNANTVMLTRSGMTSTTGANSDGVVAQSIGGGGGNGGLNVSGALAGSGSGSSFSAALGLGGFGGVAGNAGNVTANISGDVFATGIEAESIETIDGVERRVMSGGSNGIVAQSIGGSGGNGGVNVSAGIALTRPGGSSTGSALTLGVGGFGGGAGNAGVVDLDVIADNVVSRGDTRAAVMAQSVGGGGGNGALNVSAGIVMDGAVTVGIGGSGGSGGQAGDVDANVDVGFVSAGGEAARGVVAQSVGGGGGNGGINISGGLQADRDTDIPSLVFGMGGEGGAGNISGNVTLTQTGDVLVDGVNSIGVLAQSVAGGGGNGALNVSGSLAAGEGFAGVVGVGGSGGLGADAGNVVLTSDGAIDVSGVALAELDEAGDDFTRFGDRANGILAQSVGGGGGNGGANISGVATRGNPIALNVGASGGGGGDAGEVTVTRGMTDATLLRTRGDQANGLTAQSIGGGGGNAGLNLQFALSGVATDDEPVSAQITIGGAGGDPGNGMLTTVNHTGDIVTDGRQSVGIMAQSIGGGGGNANINAAAGFNKKSTAFNLAIGGAPGDGGNGGRVDVTHSGDIATIGDDSMAIFAQSVGGGGGNAAMNMATSLGSSNALNIGIGRVGGTGGIGGDVMVDAEGTLTTEGDRAVGVLAQSVGNAGGKSGATSVGFSSSSGEGESARSTGVNVSVGLEGGMGGRAGNVDVSLDGMVMTEGLEAHGIHAQSVGGGGGIGGAATNIVFQETSSLRIGVGGSGGDGGVAGNVMVDNGATIVTDGDRAHGVYAQSIGGGGGTGGYAGQIAIQAGGASGNGNNSLGISVGGSGGTGAAGAAVSVTNRGVVLTSGDESTGVSAQSIGGGGGDGGIVVNGTLAGNGRNNAMTVGIGGAGGSGGVSANVDVVNEGSIMTSGRDSAGIRAQSIAGGGGNAGLIVNLDISRETGSRSARTATMNIGGEGGDGAVAGDVTVANRTAADGSGGMIVTEGDDAYGILAQSIGGGGGNGSSIINGRFAQDNNTSGRNATLMSLNVGGFGGDGGIAGDVTVDNDALIDTTGENAHGVFAQSIGGGGGNGGMVLVINKVIGSAKKASNSGASRSSDRMLSVGGVGGNGGDAGTVIVNNSGQIVTRGENAHGVFAQSIGGGGGNTGWKQGGNSNKFVAGAIQKLVGALGGEGGLGGEVTVNHSGDISVFGDGAQAIKADSINGGGGTTISKFETIAGILGSAVPEIPGVGDVAPFEEIPLLGLRIGGEQQEDTNAGNVTINNTGTFGVFGDNGAGNGSMAIGGGGGTATVDVNLGLAEETDEEIAAIDVDVELGGLDGQNNAGGDLDSRHDGDILSMGQNSHGVALQSVGGGGGRANYAFSGDSTLLGELSYRLGGTNGSNESGGLIDHVQNGNVVTEGDLSHGLFASSVGGGGGSLSLSFDFDEPDTATADSSAPQPMPAFLGAAEITLGSNGGNLLNGGDVALNYNGGIATTGNLSSGLILQSIGSGGGEARVQGAENLTVTLGGSNGASGDGGDLDLFVRDTVNTAGDRSHGVLLQSIGGGGGAVFTDLAPAAVQLSANNSGDGGAIRAVFLRDIVTQGNNANGVIAQSLGGGGGFVDGAFFGSAGGTGAGDLIDLEIAGDIFAMGEGSSAVIAQSLGSNGSGDIRVSLSANRSLVGGIGGTAITMDGLADNTVVNRGLITTMDGIAGLAIQSGAGNDTILNEGELVGSLDLGGGANAVDNALDALFESGATVDLGDVDSLLTNAGILAPGGRNLAQATELNGSFVQTASGVFETELDFLSDTLDTLNATGSVDTAGDVVLSLLNTQVILPGEFTRTLFGSGTGYTNSGINFVTAPSVVVNYDLLETANALDLAYAVDFAPTGLGDNRTSTGDYFNRVQLAGSSEELADTVIRLVAIGDLEEYRDVMTQLSPEMYAEQQAQTLAGAQSFLRNVRERCDVGDAYASEDEDECLWLRYDVQDMDRDGGLGSPEIEGDGRRYAFGWQYRRPDDSVWGVGFALDDTDFSGFGERWVTRGRSWQLSAIGELPMRNNRAMVLQAALGQSSYETQRLLDVTSSYLAEADNDVVFLSGLVGLLDRREIGRYRFESGVDLGYAYLKGNSLSEIGASAQNLIVDGRSDNYFWITPSVEVSTGSLFANDVNWELFGRVGVQYYLNDPNTTSIGRLAGGPVGVTGMGNEADLDRTHGIFGIGLRATSGNLRFSLSYDADESSNRSASGVNGKLIFTF